MTLFMWFFNSNTFFDYDKKIESQRFSIFDGTLR